MYMLRSDVMVVGWFVGRSDRRRHEHESARRAGGRGNVVHCDNETMKCDFSKFQFKLFSSFGLLRLLSA